MQIQLSNEDHVKDYVKSTIYTFLKFSHHQNYINYLFDKWHDQHLNKKDTCQNLHLVPKTQMCHQLYLTHLIISNMMLIFI